jgi:hypothetical protein
MLPEFSGQKLRWPDENAGRSGTLHEKPSETAVGDPNGGGILSKEWQKIAIPVIFESALLYQSAVPARVEPAFDHTRSHRGRKLDV